MNTLLTLPCAAAQESNPVEVRGPAAEDRVRQQVWRVLAGLYPPGHAIERRSEQRFPLARLVQMTLVASDGLTPLEESVVVVGKDISERGLGFFHREPLAQRRMIAAFEVQAGCSIAFLIDIHWCRFTRHGWYDSGGRLLQVVPAPWQPEPSAAPVAQ